MAQKSESPQKEPGTGAGTAPLGSARIDWAMALVSLWLLGGLHLDGWAHTHKPELETFFTPWHGVLYSGLFAAAALTGALFLRGRARGWQAAMPAGYGLTAWGVAIFFAGGAADMVWHVLLGVETSVEALISPTHLLLALGLVLIAGGPLRAAMRQSPTSPTLGALAPALTSAALALSTLTFFTQYVHPFVRPWGAIGNAPAGEVFLLQNALPPIPQTPGGVASEDIALAMGMGSVIVQAALLTGLLLILLRRWRLPFGSITLVLTLNAALLGLMRDQHFVIAVALAAGLALDALALRIRPTPDRPAATRAFAFAAPFVLYALYVIATAILAGLWWKPHVWAGVPFIAGAAGLFVGYLATSPGR